MQINAAPSLPTENLAASFFSMSSVGFTPQSRDHELEQLREAWRSLNDMLMNLRNAEAALINRDHNLIAGHLQEDNCVCQFYPDQDIHS